MPLPLSNFSSMAAVDAADLGSSASSLAQAAWGMIRDDIIAGRLTPNARLRLSKLRDRYGIGASPLREALSRLAAEGFVVSSERRGFAVAPISLTEFRELTDLRKLLEKECLRLSMQHGDDKWEASVLGAFHRLGKVQKRLSAGDAAAIDEWEKLNHEFHGTLVAACPSGWLRRFRELVYLYADRFRRICLASPAPGRDVQREHQQLRDAVLDRDVGRTHRLIDEHLERTYRKVEASGLR
jgi:GntR family transcriptional regulator, carbon starvation induced regulator